MINTVAGSAVRGSAGDGGLATNAELRYPTGVTIDSNGNLYIADQGNNRIRKVSALTGEIATIAGGSGAGYAGDGGLATSAELYEPAATAIDSLGNIYIADEWNNRVRMICASATSSQISGITCPGAGIIIAVAGSSTQGFGGDGGLATQAELYYPVDVIVDSSFNLYIADSYNNRIRMVTAATGFISTVAGRSAYGNYGGDGGPAASAYLNAPFSIAFDSSGDLFIADSANNRIRKIKAPASGPLSGGTITTVAGTGVSGYAGDGGPAANAEMYFPTGVAVDSSGDVNVLSARQSGSVNPNNCGLRKVIAAGSLAGNIYTVAGNGICGYSGDSSLATSAEISSGYASSVAIDSLGNLYIPDYANSRIRAFGASSVITPTLSLSTSGTPSTFGGALTITATISSFATGTVTFYDGGVAIGTGTISGSTATLTTNTLTAGTHTFTVRWAGNAEFGAATSTVFSQVINKATPAISISTSTTSAVYGTPITFTAAASPALATGTITFETGSTVLGSASLANGTASLTTTALQAGSDPITAIYGGDSNDFSSSGVLQSAVQVNKMTLTIVANGQPMPYGGPLPNLAAGTNYYVQDANGRLYESGGGVFTGAPTLSFSANVTVTSPPGTVDADGEPYQVNPTIGSFALTAPGALNYVNTPMFESGTVTISMATPTVAIQQDTVAYGNAPVVDVTVSNNKGNAVAPTGTVTFTLYDPNNEQVDLPEGAGTATLTNGEVNWAPGVGGDCVSVCGLFLTTLGSYEVDAEYSGVPSLIGRGNTGVGHIVVGQANSALYITNCPSAAVTARSYTLTVLVTWQVVPTANNPAGISSQENPGGIPTPTGQVTLTEVLPSESDAPPIPPVTLNSISMTPPTASFTVAPATQSGSPIYGPYTFTANYPGDTNYLAVGNVTCPIDFEPQEIGRKEPGLPGEIASGRPPVPTKAAWGTAQNVSQKRAAISNRRNSKLARRMAHENQNS